MKKLFTEFKIKNLEIKNRICVPPMVVFLAENNGYVTNENIEHYKSLSKGGPGLIIQEATFINSDGKLGEKQIGIWEDEQIKGLKKIVEAVHSENCKIFVQIHHAGVVGISENKLCPSPYKYTKSNGNEVLGKELTIDEIKSIENNFIQAGKRAYKAGYDGIELHGCHSYIISQFLNKKVNIRTDEYGKSPELFVLNILRGIRKETSENFVVGIRLGGYQPTLEDGIKHAKLLEKDVDFFNISYGFYNEQEIGIKENSKFSDAVYAAERIKHEVSVPVFAVDKINSGDLAEEILTKTGVDVVNIGRGFLINPNWANDIKAGRYPGKCIKCKTCKYIGSTKDTVTCPGIILFNKEKNK